MRVLLDNNIPIRFLDALAGMDITQVRLIGLDALFDGPLLGAIAGRFDVLVTMDRNLQHQQNLVGRSFAVVVLRARTNRLKDILPLVAPLKRQLDFVQNGRVYEVINPLN